MGRPIRALNYAEQQDLDKAEIRRLRWQIRRLENQQSNEVKRYRAAPNLEGVDPEIYGP